MDFKQKKKIYNQNYFQQNSKLRVKHCQICNKDVKYNSFLNHLKSKKHLQNQGVNNAINEDFGVDNWVEDIKHNRLNEEIRLEIDDIENTLEEINERLDVIDCKLCNYFTEKNI